MPGRKKGGKETFDINGSVHLFTLKSYGKETTCGKESSSSGKGGNTHYYDGRKKKTVLSDRNGSGF